MLKAQKGLLGPILVYMGLLGSGNGSMAGHATPALLKSCALGDGPTAGAQDMRGQAVREHHKYGMDRNQDPSKDLV